MCIRFRLHTHRRFGRGEQYDASTGLYYDLARYYDPSVGRFISQDPSGYAGGSSNLYEFANNNPQTYVDPTGLEVQVAIPQFVLSEPNHYH